MLELQQRWRGRLIDRSDGLLLLFERPVDGLGFALDYARGLRELGERPEVKQRKLELRARAGLHVGEVLTWHNSEAAVQAGAKPLEVEGIAKPLAGRLMSLARPGQILLSATAEPLARRASRELGERAETLIWKSHGRWRFKGMPDGQEIFEVGEPGHAPLRAPKQNTGKAWRDIPLWRRPAALAAEILLVVGMGTGLWFVTRPTPAIAFNERDWVVVGDLRNLTGDAVLDESLEQAFRISLEQSRYVNVLSDLKVRETLQRMQRKADSNVDRDTGSEIALRDGARALLLPTVAEVGGRLRVSLEVVDPRSQTTVYTMYADGKGLDSALESIDDVTGQVREKFGEALESVERASIPLPNVATPSLDALKAFAIARNEMDTNRDREQALGMYRRALQLDPKFALAHADMARLHASLGEVAAARDEWRTALAIPERLSPREKLRIELMLQQHQAPALYFRKVEQFLALYPDDYDVKGRTGTNLWHQLNDFRQAEASFRSLLGFEYPRLGSATYSLAVILLGQDRYPEAMAAFGKARQLGFTGARDYYALAYEIHGQRAESERVYAERSHHASGWQGDGGVTILIGRGQWAQAEETARAWLQQSEQAGDPLEVLRARAAHASISVLGRRADASVRMRELEAAVREKAEAADAIYPPMSAELDLFGGLLSAYDDDAAGVAAALARAKDKPAVRDFPTLAQLQQVVLAEQDRLAGKPEVALSRLRSIAGRDDALVVVHWALERSARAAGDTRIAQAEARWLETHPGRAAAESTTADVLRFVNVPMSAQARKSPVRPEKPAGATTAGRPLKNVPAA
ncbi:MAG TPA: putative peptide modification system cyclase [Lysobacter sp.]|nr:putative peptide modification system cyclase [Lysobacter sp.]